MGRVIGEMLSISVEDIVHTVPGAYQMDFEALPIGGKS
jgi:hypothetical protein